LRVFGSSGYNRLSNLKIYEIARMLFAIRTVESSRWNFPDGPAFARKGPYKSSFSVGRHIPALPGVSVTMRSRATVVSGSKFSSACVGPFTWGIRRRKDNYIYPYSRLIVLGHP
jgi:hypothetical protein